MKIIVATGGVFNNMSGIPSFFINITNQLMSNTQ